MPSRSNERSVAVDFGVVADVDDNTDYRVISMEAVPAFASGDDYEIPDGIYESWVRTNPKIHAEEAIAAQKRYNDEWKGIVRMAKYWNNHNGKPIKPSFLLEVMALDCLYGGYSGNFPHEFQSLFATLADRMDDRWPDPAGLGSPVDQEMTPAMRATARVALQKASQAATNASYLVRVGKTGEALDAWRELFGPKFPLS